MIDARYRRLLVHLRPYKARVAAAIGAGALSAVAAAAYAYLAGPLLQAVLADGPVEVAGRELPSDRLRVWLPASLVAVALIKALGQWLHGGWMQGAAQRALESLRAHLYGRLLLRPPQSLDEHHSGELLSRLTSDLSKVEFSLSQALTSYFKDGLTVLALLAVCFTIDPRLFVFAFFVVPAAAYPVGRFARSVRKVTRTTQASVGRLTTLASESFHNLPAVQAYGAEGRTLATFEAEQGRYLKAMRRSLFLRGAFSPTVEVMGFFGAAAAIGFGAQAVAREPELSGKLLSFLAATLLLYQPVKALSQTFGQVSQGLGAADRLFELADLPVGDEGDAGDGDGDGGDRRAAGPLSRSLRFESLTVRYTPDGPAALDGVTFEVSAGERVALVGASGAGKSTLFSVLLGHVDPEPDGGRVLWDGVPLSELSGASVRAQLAWVPQEPVLFSGTIRENLLLARPDADDEALLEALRRASATDFVHALAAGLDGEVGERGRRLSGGERQRLALARAFSRAPSLLLLDEPTSALDAASEQAVQAGLAELTRGRTTLVIAHRLATVREADRVLVLDGGRLVEEGTHETLAARGGLYSALLQAGALEASDS